jgi:hypothetical protein
MPFRVVSNNMQFFINTMFRKNSISTLLALAVVLSACGAGDGVRISYDSPKENKPSKLVYGNYCGFGTRFGTLNTFPVDNLDAACREHDACYIAGKDRCFCDGTLATAAAEIYRDPETRKKTRAAARLVLETFSTPFCKYFPAGVFRPRSKDILKTRVVAPRNSAI